MSQAENIRDAIYDIIDALPQTMGIPIYKRKRPYVRQSEPTPVIQVVVSSERYEPAYESQQTGFYTVLVCFAWKRQGQLQDPEYLDDLRQAFRTAMSKVNISGTGITDYKRLERPPVDFSALAVYYDYFVVAFEYETLEST